MENISLTYGLLIAFLLLLGSAFFCFSEGSLFSLGRHQRDSLRKEGTRTSKLIEKLLSSPFKLIITILFADEVVNVAYSSVVGLTVQELFPSMSERAITFISLAIASPTLLLLGEIGPKTIAVKFPRVIARAVALPLHVFHVLIAPIRWVLMILSIGFTKLLGGNVEYEQHTDFSSDELRILVGMGSEEGVLNEVEKELIGRFYQLEEIPVHKIMNPSIDCFFLPEDFSAKKAVYEIKKRGYSRIPVYSDDPNNIVGILYSKDLLNSSSIDDEIQNQTIKPLLKKPYFIPRTKAAFELLREFQQKRIHIAIVVDEYGRFSGLVTMDDILEELFGKIEDETRVEPKPKVEFEGNSLVVPGKMKIDEFNDNFLFMILRFAGLEKLGEVIESSLLPSEEEHETLGGFIFDLFGRFPVEGESVDYKSLRFTVNRILKKRISEIKVEFAEEVADVA